MTPKEERLGRVVEIEKEVAELLKEVSSYNLKSSTMPGFGEIFFCPCTARNGADMGFSVFDDVSHGL